jgi:hypothetical protein
MAEATHRMGLHRIENKQRLVTAPRAPRWQPRSCGRLSIALSSLACCILRLERASFLTGICHTLRLSSMGAVRKITINVPADVLDDATRITGKGVTATVIEGLAEIRQREMRSALRRLKGKVRFELDLTKTRR